MSSPRWREAVFVPASFIRPKTIQREPRLRKVSQPIRTPYSVPAALLLISITYISGSFFSTLPSPLISVCQCQASHVGYHVRIPRTQRPLARLRSLRSHFDTIWKTKIFKSNVHILKQEQTSNQSSRMPCSSDDHIS